MKQRQFWRLTLNNLISRINKTWMAYLSSYFLGISVVSYLKSLKLFWYDTCLPLTCAHDDYQNKCIDFSCGTIKLRLCLRSLRLPGVFRHGSNIFLTSLKLLWTSPKTIYMGKWFGRKKLKASLVQSARRACSSSPAVVTPWATRSGRLIWSFSSTSCQRTKLWSRYPWLFFIRAGNKTNIWQRTIFFAFKFELSLWFYDMFCPSLEQCQTFQISILKVGIWKKYQQH